MLSVIMLIVTPEKYLGIVGIACAWFADFFFLGVISVMIWTNY
jgi:hypothetical protein